jgi:MoaA/NifB/PqqE/SkfB family radical SAM enzyme
VQAHTVIITRYCTTEIPVENRKSITGLAPITGWSPVRKLGIFTNPFFVNILRMKRTLTTGITIWRSRGLLWPVALLLRATACSVKKTARGLIVEPSQGCTGGCIGCSLPKKPSVLEPETLEAWLGVFPAKPVTIHFSGKHSDPLASPDIESLAVAARRHCSMLSISTIGLGMKPGLEQLAVDRWIFSIPAATEKSWIQLRGNNRLQEAIETINTVRENSTAMVEVVLTIWKASADDIKPFNALKNTHSWKHTKVVFGRFDPDGYHFGRLENIAVNSRECPYSVDENNTLSLKNTPQGCPLSGYLFLDAQGTLRPCPFTGDESPHLTEPEQNSWKQAGEWVKNKNRREYPACRWCPQ